MAEPTIHEHMDPCPYWLSGLLDNPVRRWLHNPRRMFAGLVQEGSVVLDLGCGPGTFTLALARLVGASGQVIAVDLQVEMLERVKRNAARAGLGERIRLHRSTPQQIGLDPVEVDFAVAFWMVHEVENQEGFLEEVYRLLKPGGCFLVVEPHLHVASANFEQTVAKARAAGLKPIEERKVWISRAVVFQK